MATVAMQLEETEGRFFATRQAEHQHLLITVTSAVIFRATLNVSSRNYCAEQHQTAGSRSRTDQTELRRGGKFIGMHSDALLFGIKGEEGTVNRVE